MKKVSLLFLGDNPTLMTGLGRIGRDLATRVSGMDEYRVGYLGRGGIGSTRVPFQLYTFPEREQWGEAALAYVWSDFSRGEPGAVLSIWDPSRLHWFGDPQIPRLEWLKSPPFKKWGYFPIDHSGVGGGLTELSTAAVRGYDRVLGYGVFGAGVLEKVLHRKVDWIPHGLADEFTPRDSKGFRLGVGADKLIGCVMTNQVRKDWGLAFATANQIRQLVPGVKFWFKTDVLDRHWDFNSLVADFQMKDHIVLDFENDTDEELSYKYSACDCTFLPSTGEGFGYPIVESLGCGTPCIHIDYAGGAELVPREEWLVRAKAWRLETRHDCVRPVCEPEDFTTAIMGVMEKKKPVEECVKSVEHLRWGNLWGVWEKWFREGVKRDDAGVQEVREDLQPR